jgi:hypothetical protein
MEDEMERACSTYGKKRNSYRLLMPTPGRKESLRQRRRLVYNIKIDLGEIYWSGVEWIDLAQDRYQ